MFDLEAIRSNVMTILVQVNGRVRDSIELAHDTSEDEVKRQALAAEKVQRFLAGNNVHRVIYVPGRLVNIVTG
jgi:leucyl-tRNA synthetase